MQVEQSKPRQSKPQTLAEPLQETRNQIISYRRRVDTRVEDNEGTKRTLDSPLQSARYVRDKDIYLDDA